MNTPSRNLKDNILSFLSARPRHRLTPLEVLKGIGAKRDELDAISDGLRELALEGRIVRLKKNHYALPQAQNCVTGRVHAHPDGYGFLIPDDKARDDVY